MFCTFSFQGVVILMISLSYDISKIKPCDLETALDSIYLEFTPHPCKYNAIKEMATQIKTLASFQLVWMFWNLFYVPYLLSLARIKNRRWKLVICVVVVSTFVHRCVTINFFVMFLQIYMCFLMFLWNKCSCIRHAFSLKIG